MQTVFKNLKKLREEAENILIYTVENKLNAMKKNKYIKIKWIFLDRSILNYYYTIKNKLKHFKWLIWYNVI